MFTTADECQPFFIVCHLVNAGEVWHGIAQQYFIIR